MLIRHLFIRRLIGMGLLNLFSMVNTFAATDFPVVTLHYNQRVPYEYSEQGEVHGLVASKAEKAFKAAGFAYRWEETPVARQFHIIKSNAGMDCLAGRFKNPEREQWARFSKPIYRDLPQGLIVRKDQSLFNSFPTLESAILSTSVRFLVKGGNSYGSLIDGYIKARERPVQTTYDENYDMLRQVSLGMSDAFVIAQDEAEGLMAANPQLAASLVFKKYDDSPPGSLRYVMCSQKVPQQLIERLNSKIVFKE